MIDVGVGTFEREVIERSRLGPVVVDFWAPWCGPCRTLGPVLEDLERESGGAWTLAKVNTDDSPALGQRYRVEGIPAVKAFVDGEVVAEFVGAQPEAKVRAWLAALVPAPAEKALAAALAAEGAGDAKAEGLFDEVLRLDPQNPVALLRRAARASAVAEAAATLARLAPADRARFAPDTARVELASVGVLGDGQAGAAADCWRRAGEALSVALARPDDTAAWQRAAELLLEMVTAHRGFVAPGYGADPGRKALLSVFDVLGAEDPVARSFRRRLAMELYS